MLSAPSVTTWYLQSFCIISAEFLYLSLSVFKIYFQWYYSKSKNEGSLWVWAQQGLTHTQNDPWWYDCILYFVKFGS